jgi:hypothetical protein
MLNKFSWGTGIALFYGAFVIGMLSLVMATRKHDPGLVQKDYYALDLNYQERLERKQNARALLAPPKVWVMPAEKSLNIQLPEGMENAAGTTKFYRSATVKDDFSVEISNGEPMQLNTEKMASGRWHVEMEWEAGGKKYFWETAVVI